MNLNRKQFLALLRQSLRYKKQCALLFGGLVLASVIRVSYAQTELNSEYVFIGYEGKAHHNPIARLAERLQNGETKLRYENGRGYFDSLLQELNISPSSQVLVFSPTSLQYRLISSESPRALYFNDDTYVAWVQGSKIVEIATVDDQLGNIFYLFNNQRDTWQYFERTNQKCLVCHDSYGTMGGGVPLMLARSSIYNRNGQKLLDISGESNVGDNTPIADRWGGWFVTGRSGKQSHVGNVVVESVDTKANLQQLHYGDVEALSGLGFFDTQPYLRATSDIVALMLMEHQITVQNQITYVKFKAPIVLQRMGLPDAIHAPNWQALPSRAQHNLRNMLDKLVAVLLLADAAEFEDTISGNDDFKTWFEAQGPRDQQRRSLRELDLNKQLFKYPLSYLIYSDAFDSLPPYAKDYVYQQLAVILEGRDHNKSFSHLSTAERKVILEILAATKTEFAVYTFSEDSSLSASEY